MKVDPARWGNKRECTVKGSYIEIKSNKKQKYHDKNFVLVCQFLST